MLRRCGDDSLFLNDVILKTFINDLYAKCKTQKEVSIIDRCLNEYIECLKKNVRNDTVL